MNNFLTMFTARYRYPTYRQLRTIVQTRDLSNQTIIIIIYIIPHNLW